MDRRGNRDEKPSYEELASALRWITHVRKHHDGEPVADILKMVIRLAKKHVDALDKVEAKQYKDVVPVPLKPEQMIVFKGCKADKYTIYRNDGSNGEQA